MLKRSVLFMVISLSLFLGTIFAQQQGVSQKKTEMNPQETEIQWLWGEVVSVDAQYKKLAVKYLDYETDTDKEISISVARDTTFENIKSIAEIKVQDNISIDYIPAADGSGIAKNISVERIEGLDLIQQEIADTQAAVEKETGALPK